MEEMNCETNDCEGCGTKVPAPSKVCMKCYRESLSDNGEEVYY